MILRKAIVSDAEYIADRCRAVDRTEWALGGHRDMAASLQHAIERAMFRPKEFFAHAIVGDDDKPVVVFGMDILKDPDREDHKLGWLWLIARHDAPRMAKSIFRAGAGYIDACAEHVDRLTALSYGGNTVHHRWLEHLGFARIRTIWWGSGQFIHFEKKGSRGEMIEVEKQVCVDRH